MEPECLSYNRSSSGAMVMLRWTLTPPPPLLAAWQRKEGVEVSGFVSEKEGGLVFLNVTRRRGDDVGTGGHGTTGDAVQ